MSDMRQIRRIIMITLIVLVCASCSFGAAASAASAEAGAAEASSAASAETEAEDVASAAHAADGAVRESISRYSMTTLEIEKLAEFLPPEPGAYHQGAAVTSDGLCMAFLSGESSEGNPLLVLDADAWQPAASLTEELSHANDLCYVPAAGEIYVLPMDVPQIIVLDEETFEVKRTIDVPQIYHAIGYDEDRDCFAAIYAEGKGSEKRLTCDILDNTCTKVLRSFPTDTNLVYQGLAVHDSKVYYSCWKREEGSTEHKTVYDDLLEVNDNVVYVYDYEGNLVDAMLIRMPEGYNTFEIEAVSFLGDRMILTFNENLADEDNTLMIGVWGQSSTSLE